MGLLSAFKKKNITILILVVFLLLTLFYQVPVYSADPPQMRVGISITANHLELSFDSGYTLINMVNGTPLQLAAGRYRIVKTGGSIQVLNILNASQGVFSGPLYLKPLSSQPSGQAFQIHNARYGSEYRGALEILIEGSGLRAVNIIDMESYLRGVLPREMPPSWGNYGGMEALKAQAVAARSYALYNQSLQRHSGYHVCDSQHCQVYGGKSCETANTDTALSQTRGMILTFNGKIIQPFYHATNGGHTELTQNVWSGALPYFNSVPDPFDDSSNPLGLNNFIVHNHASWEADVPINSLHTLLESKGYNNPGQVEQITVASSFPSGRVHELQILGTGGKVVSLLKERARTVLGLRSQLYSVRNELQSRVWIASAVSGVERKESFSELEGKWGVGGNTMKRMLIGEWFTALGNGTRSQVPYMSFIIDGRGWGHGIGMSQNGAYNRSRAGQNHNEILSFYYPGAQIHAGY